MPSRIRPQLGNEMRIGQEAYVEQQVNVLRHPVLVAKTYTRDRDLVVRRIAAKLVDRMRAQLVHVELRRVDDEVRKVAYVEQCFTFGRDRLRDRRRLPQRMRPPRLTEAAHQHI